MTDELEFDLDDNNNQEEIISRKDKKIRSLSEKYEFSEKEKSDLTRAKEEAEAKAQASEKESAFYKGFNQVASKYQGASEYQDKILEKVNAGYDIEDATVAVLNKEGKFIPQVEREMAAGGSASTGITDNVDKTAKDMSQEDRRSLLLEMESKGEFRL